MSKHAESRLPIKPGRNNFGGSCELVPDDGDDLPENITPCACDEHTGVCDSCGFKITIGPKGTQYGHARRSNRSGRDYRDCPHRPKSVDPIRQNPNSKQ